MFVHTSPMWRMHHGDVDAHCWHMVHKMPEMLTTVKVVPCISLYAFTQIGRGPGLFL